MDRIERIKTRLAACEDKIKVMEKNLPSGASYSAGLVDEHQTIKGWLTAHAGDPSAVTEDQLRFADERLPAHLEWLGLDDPVPLGE